MIDHGGHLIPDIEGRHERCEDSEKVSMVCRFQWPRGSLESRYERGNTRPADTSVMEYPKRYNSYGPE